MSMLKPAAPKLVALSEKMYARLLVLYPGEHRREFGPAMAQLFRDQSRDAWTDARARGLALLWLRTSLDLLKTSMLEHLRNLKQRTSMLNQTLLAFRRNPTPGKTFLALFAAVFAVVLASSIGLAFLTPEGYQGITRIRVGTFGVGRISNVDGAYDPRFLRDQMDLVTSETILGGVAKKLKLAESWGKNSEPLTDARTIKRLKKMISVRPVVNTSIVDISVLDKDPNEASAIANAVAETFQESRREQAQSAANARAATAPLVEIIDSAIPGLRPISPNRPLTLFVGIFGGAFLALVVGGFGAIFTRPISPSKPPIITA